MRTLNVRTNASAMYGWHSRSIMAFMLLAMIAIATLVPSRLVQPSSAASPSLDGLHVEGNKLVNGGGQAVRLLGVNRSGTEYACIQGWGFHDGPADLATVQAIASWNANAVRVPLNETCWLGINGAPTAYSGTNYQNEIARWVSLINQAGLAAILDLHWSAPGTAKATGQQPMANRDHSPEFWRQVATRFKGNSLVVFDLFNEPYPDGNRNTTEAWRCWRDGGTCAGLSYQAAGMRELVDAVRGTGATNVVMLGGVQYAGGLWQWLDYKPTDPTGNLAAAWHTYDFSWYTNETDWDQMLGPVVEQVPLVTGEVGEHEEAPCTTTYFERVLNWLDAHQASYLAWTWNRWGKCTDLVVDWAGTPTSPYGATYKDHLAAQAGSSDTTAPTVTASPAGGTYDAAQTVTLTASEPATIYYTTDETTPTTGSTQYSSPLTINTTTTLKFMAVDQAGNQSSISTELYTIATTQAPAAPTNLSATRAGNGKNQRIGLSWTDNSGDEANFVIERSTSSGFTTGNVTYEVGANTTSYTDTTVKRKTTYYYRVFAVNASGVPSAPSNVASATTQ